MNHDYSMILVHKGCTLCSTLIQMTRQGAWTCLQFGPIFCTTKKSGFYRKERKNFIYPTFYITMIPTVVTYYMLNIQVNRMGEIMISEYYNNHFSLGPKYVTYI
jgi:hypothetical protein